MQEFVKNKKMYHFIDKERIDNNWNVKSEFVIDNTYDSYSHYYFEAKPCINFDENNSLYEKITQARNNNIKKDELTKLANLTQSYLRYSPIILREYILESIRLREFPELISRSHCLFLTDKESLNFWKEELKNYELYKVEVTGLLFSSYECLLPQNDQSILTQEYQARCYWQEKIDDYLKFCDHFKNDREYLFQGNVKVLKKIDKI